MDSGAPVVRPRDEGRGSDETRKGRGARSSDKAVYARITKSERVVVTGLP